MKKFSKILLLTVLMLIFAAALCACAKPNSQTYKENDLPIDKFYTLDDIYVPEIMRESGLGLFVYDEMGHAYKFDTAEAVATLDPEKPIVIFAHGMQFLTGNTGDESFTVFTNDVDDNQISKAISQNRDLESFMIEDYNVLAFRWSQLADDGPLPGMRKVWSTDGEGAMRWSVEPKYFEQLGVSGVDRYLEEDDVMSVPVAMYYGACLVDFLTRANYIGDIRLSGHSLGGELTMATADYLFDMYEYGFLDKKFLPSQIILLDPFMTATTDYPFKVFWTDEQSDGNSLQLFVNTAKKLKQIGIPVTEIQSGYAVSGLPRMESMDSETGKSPLFYELLQNVIYIKYDSSWISPFDPSALHTVSRSMYYYSALYAIPTDTSTGNYVGNFNLPVAYAKALCGVYFEMDKNTDFKMDNDVYFAAIPADAPAGTVDTRKTTVCGCIFNDTNEDGFMNDSMASRLGGVKVSLYKQGVSTPVQTAVCNEWGNYLFLLDESETGSNYYVSFEADGYVPTDKNAFIADPDNPRKWGYMYDSNINEDNSSDMFIISYNKEIIVINAGFVQE